MVEKAPAGVSFGASERITLNEKEEQIFNTLKNVMEKKKLPVTLRVAGGWVRDKVRFISEGNLRF